MYRSAPYIEEFVRLSKEAAATVAGDDYEIVIVDDGSPDDAADVVGKIMKTDSSNIKLFELTRNFGHHRALLAGLTECSGDYVFMIDCDLEESPELLIEFWENMRGEPELDVVYGIQSKRKGGFFERVSGSVFYFIFDLLRDIPYASNQLTARLMKREYVNSVLEYRETELDLWGVFSLAGYRQKALTANKKSKGSTTYTLARKIAIAVEMITSFSVKPLMMILATGFLITFGAVAYVIYLVIWRFFTSDVPSGWTSTVVSIWFLGGVILLSLGVIGLYQAKIFMEVKRRPRFHARRVDMKKD